MKQALITLLALATITTVAHAELIDSHFTTCEAIDVRYSQSPAFAKSIKAQGYTYACDNQKPGADASRLAGYLAKYPQFFAGGGCHYDTGAGEYHCHSSKRLK